MQYTKVGERFVIKVEKGEEVIGAITSLCVHQGIENGFFSGIGAVQGLSCGYYELDEKKYYFKKYDEMVEVVSLTGNIMLKDGAPFIHAHGVFTDTTNKAFGGHIENMYAGIVVEIILEVLPSKIERAYHEGIGLYLLSCEI